MSNRSSIKFYALILFLKHFRAFLASQVVSIEYLCCVTFIKAFYALEIQMVNFDPYTGTSWQLIASKMSSDSLHFFLNESKSLSLSGKLHPACLHAASQREVQRKKKRYILYCQYLCRPSWRARCFDS